MRSAYLLCGPSLAGKSTLCRQIVERIGAVVSAADEINARRGLPFGAEGLPDSVWAETLRVQLHELQAAGLTGCSVVVDDTLCFRWLRDRFRSAASAAGLEPRLLLLRPDAETIRRRWELAARAGSRPVLSAQRLEQHLDTFEWPTVEECAIDVTTPAQQLAWLNAEMPPRC